MCVSFPFLCHVCMYRCMYMHMQVLAQNFMFSHEYGCTCVHICIGNIQYMCAYICVRIYVRIYAYTHTHTCIHTCVHFLPASGYGFGHRTATRVACTYKVNALCSMTVAMIVSSSRNHGCHRRRRRRKQRNMRSKHQVPASVPEFFHTMVYPGDSSF
jgi:hypothetical protein